MKEQPSRPKKLAIEKLAASRRRTRRPLITGFPAVLDACVLANVTVRDFMLSSASLALYRPVWSHDILRELRGVLCDLIETENRVDYLMTTMQGAFPEAETDGYESLIPAMGNHEKDRHVLAAAIVSRSQVIVTFNIKDFPENAVSPFHIQVKNPDDFLCDLLDIDEERMIEVLSSISEARQMPPQTIPELLDALRNNGCPNFADALEAVIAARFSDQ